MPFFDGTGPRGMGPMTGRGFGPCGRGYGFRAGFGRCFRRFGYRAYSQPFAISKEEQKKILEAQLEQLDIERKELEKMISDLKEKKEK